jgi:hypothetical protein
MADCRSVAARGTAGAGPRASQAKAQAHSNLESWLERDFDLVPCPQCGRYQPFMFLRARWWRHLWLFWVACGLAGIALAFLAL